MNRFFSLMMAALLLGGCGSTGHTVVDTSGAAVATADAYTHASAAEVKARAVLESGAKPGDATVKGIVSDLDATRAAEVKAQAQIKSVQKAANQVEKERDYFRSIAANKVKYILIAFFLGALVFYAGEWAKLASPYTVLLPDVIAGMLAVMLLAMLGGIAISLWDSFGWILHLFL